MRNYSPKPLTMYSRLGGITIGRGEVTVLREYLKLIIKKMSRCGEYKTDISHEIKDGQYSFFEAISIVHNHLMQS